MAIPILDPESPLRKPDLRNLRIGVEWRIIFFIKEFRVRNGRKDGGTQAAACLEDLKFPA